MPNYLILENNEVINIILADNKDIAEEVSGKEAIEQPNEFVGIGFSRVDNEWVNLYPVEPPTTEGSFIENQEASE